MTEACLRAAAIGGSTAWTLASRRTALEPQKALHRWAGALLRHLGLRVRLEGNLSHDAGLWVGNHLSWLDPIVLLSLRPMGVLAKGEVAAYPVIGSACRKLGLAFVDRLDPASRAGAVARLLHELRRGNPMLLFPEGTTTTGDGLAPLQEGGLRAAYRCGASLQPFVLASPDARYPWIGDDALLPHLGRLLWGPGLELHVRVKPVLHPRDFDGETAWIEAIRQALTPHP